MQAAQLRAQEQLQGQQQLQGIAAQDAAAQGQLVGGLMDMAGTALASGLQSASSEGGAKGKMGGMSDIRSKTNIGDGAPAVDALLSNPPQPITYTYRDPANGEGERLGVAAQQLPPQLTRRGRDGMLRIDGPRALSANLAASAQLARRVNTLEADRGNVILGVNQTPRSSQAHSASYMNGLPSYYGPTYAPRAALAARLASPAPVVAAPAQVAPAPVVAPAPEASTSWGDLYTRPGIQRTAAPDVNNAMLTRAARRAARTAARGGR